MVICVNGIPLEEVPPDMSSLFHMHPGYRDSASLLLSVPTKVVGPMGLLYVLERELAVTVPHDKNVSILGTDDATTCVMAVLRHTGSGAVGLTHILGYGFEDAVLTLIQRVRELSQGFAEGRLDLSLVGSFADSRNFSESVFQAIMHPFHKHSCEVDLRLACIGEVNTTIRDGIPWPIISGIGVNVKTGEIFPATFPDRGPEQSLRRARHLTGGHQVLDIYDCSLGLHRIGPFNYEPLRGVDLWLEQSDEFIIQHLSTSPEVESSHFTGMIRQSLKYIQEHPFPAVTVFRDNRPHYYKRDEITGTILIDYFEGFRAAEGFGVLVRSRDSITNLQQIKRAPRPDNVVPSGTIQSRPER